MNDQWDGSLNRSPHWRSVATVIDDFGDHFQVKRCCWCRRWLRVGMENFVPRARFENGMVKLWDSACRPCRRIKQRRYYANTPEQRRKARRKAWETRRNTDPVKLERRRASNRKYQRRMRKQNPAVVREQSQAYYERIRKDPAKWAAHLERQRLNYRLRRERLGLPVTRRAPGQQAHTSGVGPEIPGEPLFRFVVAHVDRRLQQMVWENELEAVEKLGVSDKTLREWRRRRRKVVRAETADRLFTNMGVSWWDVYPKPANGHATGCSRDVLRYIDEAETYIAASLAFTGELVE